MFTNPSLRRCLAVTLLCITCCIAIAVCAAQTESESIPDQVTKTEWLDQNWSPSDREWYYYTSQGSQLMPYDIFVNLEMPDSRELLRNDRNMRDLGFVPQPPSPLNPDGLPIGIVKDGRQNFVGMTCAACHNGQMTYKGRHVIIDGGVGTYDLVKLMKQLSASTSSTLADEEKFERFARRALGTDYGADEKNILRNELRDADKERRRYMNFHLGDNKVDGGHFRLDAISLIVNNMLDKVESKTAVPITAPSSYPHVWDIPMMDFIQYDGSSGNIGVGSYERNAGEVIGVFANMDLSDPAHGYPSSIKPHNMVKLEESLRHLVSPKWPDFLPPIDKVKAKRGAQIYAQNCASCHQVIDSRDPSRRIVNQFYKPSTIGTDIARAELTKAILPSGILKGRSLSPKEPNGPKIGDTISFWDISINLNDGMDMVSLTKDLADRVTAGAPFPASHQKQGDFDKPTKENPYADLYAYKARPLNGIWATGPYLWNGSVPTLYDLMLPADQRPKKFHVKSIELDPIKVGFETKQVDGAFLFDTSVPGNSNAGHEYGAQLSDEDRWALIEYLKSL